MTHVRSPGVDIIVTLVLKGGTRINLNRAGNAAVIGECGRIGSTAANLQRAVVGHPRIARETVATGQYQQATAFLGQGCGTWATDSTTPQLRGSGVADQLSTAGNSDAATIVRATATA